MSEVMETLDQLQRAFEEFKQTNDQRLTELATKGVADPLLDGKLDRLNAAIDQHETILREVQVRMNRVGVPAPESGGSPEVKAFVAWARKGAQAPEVKGMSVSVDADGGFTVPTDLSGRIVRRVFDTSPIRQYARVVTIGAGDALEGVVFHGQFGATWAEELTTRSETTTPALKKYRIQCHELYALPRVTQQLLDDSAYDIEGEIATQVARDFALAEGEAFVTGTGLGRPRGLTTYTTAATGDATRTWGQFEHVVTGTSGSFGTAPNGSDKLIELVHKLKTGYLGSAVWVMAKSTIAEVRKLKANNEYIWLPSMEAAQPARLLGYPVVEVATMPVIAANSLSVAFGSVQDAYMVVQKLGLRALRNPYRVPGFVEFSFVWRVGGEAVDFDALKFLRFSA